MRCKYYFFVHVLMICLGFICSNTNAQKELRYPFSEIDENLLKNSNAVIREDISTYEVIDLGKGKSYLKMAITILNKKADHYAEVNIGYDKLSKIISLEGRSYDKTGRLITQLRNKDIQDYSAFDGFSIYSDNRMKYFDLRYPDYPYTIEYEVEIEENGFMSFNNWVPYSGFNVSSQKSRLEIISPENYEVRYLEINLDPTAKEEIIDGKKIIAWDFGSFEAIEHEARMPYLQRILPQVLTAPSTFELEGYAGNMNNWTSFGLWEKLLNDGRDELPEEYATKIKELVADESSQTEKIKKIYEHLQSNTRYVSIQLGIGGWQTFPAADVASNGYGDCKALSNFMKSMLKSVGITSYYTLVRAGNNAPNIITNFPSNQFNHMILCVPNYQDTIWLECTSQDNPFGYLGSFTGDRDVLVINENGGKIVHTPIYRQEQNSQIQSVNVTLHENGSAQVSVSTRCNGRQYDNYKQILDIGESEQKKWLYKNLDISNFELMEFKFDHKSQIIPELNANINLIVSRFAAVSGKRIFFQPNVLNKSYAMAIPQKERKYDFVLNYPYEDIDTVEINIPQGYHMEYIPETTSIDSRFGHYQSKIISQEGKVVYIRKHVMTKGTFPALQYIDYVKFINKIAEADKTKLVLVRST